MEKEFWLKSWENHQIGFHQNVYNSNLIKYFDKLKLFKGAHILVPLCGKSLDMIWLAEQGYKVTGIEFSEIAILEFFKENNLNYTTQQDEKFIKYESENITILQGDIFDTHVDYLKKIDGIYDRAAAVALPVPMRIRYMEKIKELCKCLNMLVILLEYDQSKIDGPPFSVSEDFIYQQFDGFNITKLKDEQADNLSSKFKKVGADRKSVV